MFRAIERTIDSMSEFFGHVAAALVLPLVFALTYEVVSRYAFGTPTVWAYELSYFMTGAILMLGIAYALKNKHHVNVDLLQGGLPAGLRAVIHLVAYVALLIVCVPFAYRVCIYALDAYLSGEHSGQSAWNPVIWPFRAIWAAGLTLFCLQIVAEIIRCLSGRIGHENSGMHK